MSIKEMLDFTYWDESAKEWKPYAIPSEARVIRTAGGSDAQTVLDGIAKKIDDTKAEIVGMAPAADDTLGKLGAKIAAIQELFKSDDVDLNEVREIVAFIKENRKHLELIGTNKVSYEDILASLDVPSSVEGKALDARMGKILRDAIDILDTELKALGRQSEDFATKYELSAVAGMTRIIPTSLPPENPMDGQIWFKLAGTIEV